ncbi:hypothetical protein HUJ05_010960 [Dendroctonus ponderosae]|nr:hypothetical protein HUJ05_010960 [Dendroctonus ponderosae]
MEGEALGAAPGDAMLLEGEWRMPEAPPIVIEEEERSIGCVEGDARIAGELTRLGRQCFTESEPDWESLLLLGEPEIPKSPRHHPTHSPGEETITWRGLRDAGDAEDACWPGDAAPTRGESGR